MRGFGQSTWSPGRDYKLETLGADVIALLDHLRWPRAVLMGHSFGGWVCLATAGWHPDRAAALICVDFAPDIAPVGRRHVAERIGRQPDVFASVDAAMAYDGHADVPAASPVRKRYEAFLRPTTSGNKPPRDLHFATISSARSTPASPRRCQLISGRCSQPSRFRAGHPGQRSDMFAAETLAKVGAANPRIAAIELTGSHDLAGDNPDGLVAAVHDFLSRTETVMTGVQPD